MSTDEGYYSVLDCSGRKQTEELQSCCDDRRKEIENIKNDHLRVVRDLEDRLEELNRSNLKYCHEIEVLKKSSKTDREETEKLKVQYLMTVKELKEQLEQSNINNLKYCCEIEALKNDGITSQKVVFELRAIVQQQDMKLQQMEKTKGNEMYGIEKECHTTVETKQNKVDLEKCKLKLYELERKYKEMLEVKKECEKVVEQKKAKVVELREDYKRKIHEAEQWKAICTVKQHDVKNIEKSYQKIMREVAEDMRKIQHSKGLQKMVG